MTVWQEGRQRRLEVTMIFSGKGTMFESLFYKLDTWLIVAILFQLMLLFVYLGGLAGLSKYRKSDKRERKGVGLGVSLIALLALLIAFSFHMASNRYEESYQLVVEEANTISTALLRTDLYEPEEREFFREDFKNYLEARIAYYESGLSTAGQSAAWQVAESNGKRIWQRTVRLAQDSANRVATGQMIPAVNEMLVTANKRRVTEKMHVPHSVILLMLGLAVATAFYAGYANGLRGTIDWLVAAGFCLLVSLTIYITLDLDRPHRGLIRLDLPQQALTELRKMLVAE